MSKSSIIGSLGFAHQTVKGTANTAYSYLPATSIGLNADQQAQALPLEVSGTYFPRLSYKSGVTVAGDASVILRPDSFGNILLMLCGQDSVTPVPAQSGAFSHVMTPFAPGVSNDLPWYTMLKNVATNWAEQYVDCRCAGVRMDITKQSVANVQASFFGLTPSEVPVPAYPPSPLDSGPAFQTCQTSVTLNTETGNVQISPQTNLVERVSLAFGSRLAQDEYVVGGFVPVDATLLSRSVQVSYDLVIRDAALRRAIYQNGGTSAWSPTIYRGHLHLTLASNALIAATTQPYQLDIDLPGIDFLMMPITMTGGELIRASLSANVSLGPSGGDTFTFTLVNATASY